MFKLFFVVIISGVVSTVQCGPMPQHQDQRQDEYAVDRFTTGLVGNPKIRKNYMDCFLDNGPCSPEAYNIKRMVPEAIQNECEHCTDLQRKVIEKMMCYLNNHQPDILKEVAAKFDPQGEYMKQYINTIERKGNEQFLNPQLHQHQPQQNPNQPQQNPNQPQQQNPIQPQQNPNQPQQNSFQSQQNPNQPQQIPNLSNQNPNQLQPNFNQPQQNQHHHQPHQNPNQPQQHQHQHQNQPQQHQHQHQHQPQQYQNQLQQYQHEQQSRATVVTSSPISTATQKP